MQDPTIYKPVTAWRTIPKNVVILTKETELLPATYQMNVIAIDRHDIGANIVDEGYYFMSYMGNPYKVISVVGISIDVEDSFRVGKCPTSGKTGIVYKSVGDGNSPFLAPIFYQYLHPTALARSKRFELDILWNKLYSEKYLLDPLKWKQNAFDVLVEFGQALGLDHLVNGEHGTAIGQGAIVNSFRELVLGSYAKDTTALSSTVWNALDLLYSLGNGADSTTRNNALEIYKSGLSKFYNAIQVGEYVHPTVDPVNGMIQYTALNGWQVWKDTEWVALGGQEEYIYLAYATSDTGTGFTTDPESKLPYEAILKSPVKIVTPVVGDFAGLWRSSGVNCKQYTAFITQSGTAAPSAIVLENTIGVIVLTRTAIGTYRLTLTGAFTTDKTSPIDDTMMDQAGNLFTLNRIDADSMELKTYAAANITVLADGIMNKRYINITVFL